MPQPLTSISPSLSDRLSSVPSGNAKFYRSPFLRDFIHLNVAMMTSNNALIPDADKEDILASSPYDWPWLWNGLRMNSWGDESVKYYLIGNPVIWWGSSASLIAFAFVLLYYLARLQRRHVDLSPRDWEQFTYVGKVAGLGWFFHYLPFLLMGRVTYIHHYVSKQSTVVHGFRFSVQVLNPLTFLSHVAVVAPHSSRLCISQS